MRAVCVCLTSFVKILLSRCFHRLQSVRCNHGQTREDGEFTITDIQQSSKVPPSARDWPEPAETRNDQTRAKTTVKFWWQSPQRMPSWSRAQKADVDWT